MARLETRYAYAGDVSTAYPVVGDGPIDPVCAQGWLMHIGTLYLSYGPIFSKTAELQIQDAGRV